MVSVVCGKLSCPQETIEAQGDSCPHSQLVIAVDGTAVVEGSPEVCQQGDDVSGSLALV